MALFQLSLDTLTPINLAKPANGLDDKNKPQNYYSTLMRAGSVRAREIGKLARKHRNRYSLQQVYEIVREHMVNRT
jgi:hypothetical protein